MKELKPFVKWAGGKRQILDKIKSFMPKTFNTYFEPFIGGGALFFDIMPKQAIINDSNKELMNIFEVLKNKEMYKKMCRILNKHEKKHSEEYFYFIRDKDKNKRSINKMKPWTRAARTIYLNKACFNGLYRVNKNGYFNVPFNGKINIKTYDEKNLSNIHNYLINKNIKILSGDFELAVKSAQNGDFVYFDPPYDKVNNSFIGYTNDLFDKESQIRLSNVYKELDKRGVFVMLSNHNTPLINELYKDYKINVINAKRMINSVGSKRGDTEEVIITNYDV